MVVEAAAAERLNPDQRQALQRWILLGGRLFMLGRAADDASRVIGNVGPASGTSAYVPAATTFPALD